MNEENVAKLINEAYQETLKIIEQTMEYSDLDVDSEGFMEEYQRVELEVRKGLVEKLSGRA